MVLFIYTVCLSTSLMNFERGHFTTSTVRRNLILKLIDTNYIELKFSPTHILMLEVTRLVKRWRLYLAVKHDKKRS